MFADFSPALLLQLMLGGATTVMLTALLLGLGAASARACKGPNAAAARISALGVAGAYAAIGLGVVLLAGAASQMQRMDDPLALAPTGLTLIALGVGFSIAAATLRALVAPSAPPPEPANGSA